MFIHTHNSSHCKFGAYQKWEPASFIADLGFFLTFSLKAHLYYPAYYTGADCSVMEFSSYEDIL